MAKTLEEIKKENPTASVEKIAGGFKIIVSRGYFLLNEEGDRLYGSFR